MYISSVFALCFTNMNKQRSTIQRFEVFICLVRCMHPISGFRFMCLCENVVSLLCCWRLVGRLVGFCLFSLHNLSSGSTEQGGDSSESTEVGGLAQGSQKREGGVQLRVNRKGDRECSLGSRKEGVVSSGSTEEGEGGQLRGYRRGGASSGSTEEGEGGQLRVYRCAPTT